MCAIMIIIIIIIKHNTRKSTEKDETLSAITLFKFVLQMFSTCTETGL